MDDKVIVVNNIANFVSENAVALDRALNRMAIDIERISKAQVPLKHGQLRSSGHHLRKGFLDYITIYNKEYAAYQEYGGDGKRVVKRYSKPGTKKHYLRDAGRQVGQEAVTYIKQEVDRVKV